MSATEGGVETAYAVSAMVSIVCCAAGFAVLAVPIVDALSARIVHSHELVIQRGLGRVHHHHRISLPLKIPKISDQRRHQMRVTRKWLEVFLITILMGAMEVDNPVVLCAFVCAILVIVVCSFFVALPVTSAAAVTLVTCSCVLVVMRAMRATVRTIEKNDITAQLYDDADARIIGEHASSPMHTDDALGPESKLVPDLEQDKAIGNTPTEISTVAAELKEPFGTEVMQPIIGETNKLPFDSDQEATNVPLVIGCASDEPTAGKYRHTSNEGLGPNVKSIVRCEEKTRLEYDGNALRLKDPLRCSVIFPALDALCAGWAVMLELEAQGVIQILQVKNRIRQRQSGYKDININVRFRGLVCEVQLHIRDYFELKREAHDSYEICRSLNLCGPLLILQDEGPIVPLPMPYRAGIFALRFACSVFACMMAFFYLPFIHLGLLLPTQPPVLKFMFGLALTMPFSMVSFLAARDGLRTEPPRIAVPAVAAVCALLLCFPVMLFPQSGSFQHGSFIIMSGAAVFGLLHFGAALLSLHWCHRNRPRSRVALVYDRVLGLAGTHFVPKVVSLQLFATVTQAAGKLPLMSRFAWMHGAGLFVFSDSLDHISRPAFWIFFAGLVVNAVYPAVLLCQQTRVVQRDAVAILDVLLDFVYATTYFFAAIANASIIKMSPTDPLGYLTSFWPIAHIFTVARALETSARHRLRRGTDADDDRMAKESRLTRRASIGYAMATFGAVMYALFTHCNTTYPLGEWDLACRPCQCNDRGELVRCIVPAELGVGTLELRHMGITRITPGAFEGFKDKYIGALVMFGNNITALERDSFRGLELLDYMMYLSTGGLKQHWHESSELGNNVAHIETGAFQGLDRLQNLVMSHNRVSDTSLSRAFGNGGSQALRSVDLRFNHMTQLRAGLFDGLSNLKLVFLDGNPIRAVDAAVFDGSSEKKYVWIPDSPVNCSQLLGTVPPGRVASCVDSASCEAEIILLLGNGWCDTHGGFDRRSCAWDAGDCKGPS